MLSKRFLASAGIAASLVWASAASAATVFIGLQTSTVSGGTITQQATGADAAAFIGSYGSFNLNIVSGLTALNSFNTNSNNSAIGAGTLNVYVTLKDITDPIGTFNVLSSFTSNTLANATVTEQTLFSSTNQLWTGTVLASQAFSSPGTASSASLVDVVSGPYSITAVYTIVALGSGAFANSTINIAAETPLPGTLPLIAGGLGALWMVGRRRKDRGKLPVTA